MKGGSYEKSQKKFGPSRIRKEKERQILYDHVKGRLEKMRHALKVIYSDPGLTETKEDILVNVVKGLHKIESVFFGLLLDRESPGDVLKIWLSPEP